MAQALSNMTSGFIDLATYDELEKYMYGGPNATAYFVRETRKATWFTNVPVVLSRSSGQADFGQTWSVGISRAGDYLLQTWLRVLIPAVTVTTAGGGAWSWVPNLMHNLVAECNISFNDLVAARFDSAHLDFWAAFTVPAGKQNGYSNMIGNIPALQGIASGAANAQTWLNLPLPFFYSRDSGVALPTAALPYNDMRITFQFRTANQLICEYAAGGPNAIVTNVNMGLAPAPPTLGGNVQVWANYAIVSNEERKRMACAPRDILIEQVQSSLTNQYNGTNTGPQQQYNIRFSHAVKVLFFGVEGAENAGTGNALINGQRVSNYTTGQLSCVAGGAPIVIPIGTAAAVADPIANASLVYENTQRLAQMGADYFSLVNPYYAAPVIPGQFGGQIGPNPNGYHEYSYSLDFINLDPLGSTNYGKLTNVSIQCQPPNQGGIIAGAGMNLIITAVNNNIIRIAGGALGFPVL